MMVIIEDKYALLIHERWLHFIRQDRKVIKIKSTVQPDSNQNPKSIYRLIEMDQLPIPDQLSLQNYLDHPTESMFMYSELMELMFTEPYFSIFFKYKPMSNIMDGE